MNDEIKVSVIVITYNHKKFIRRAIDSILSQNVSFKYEILIGDDCSTDGTRDVICEYAKMYPNLIRVFYNQINLGATRNAYNLLMQSRGEYIAACEGDDYWIATTKLEQQINFLDTHLDYVACTSKCLIVDENNSPHKKQGISWESNKNIFTLKDFNGIIIPGQVSTIVRRNFYRNKDEDFSIFYKAHTFIGDRTTTLIYLSKGKYYKFNDRLSAYRVTKNQMSNLTRIIYNSQYKFVDEFKYTLALESYATRVLNVDVNFDYYKKFLFYGAVFDFIKNPKKWKMDLIKEICNGIKDVFGLVEFLPIYVVKKINNKINCVV